MPTKMAFLHVNKIFFIRNVNKILIQYIHITTQFISKLTVSNHMNRRRSGRLLWCFGIALYFHVCVCVFVSHSVVVITHCEIPPPFIFKFKLHAICLIAIKTREYEQQQRKKVSVYTELLRQQYD